MSDDELCLLGPVVLYSSSSIYVAMLIYVIACFVWIWVRTYGGCGCGQGEMGCARSLPADASMGL